MSEKPGRLAVSGCVVMTWLTAMGELLEMVDELREKQVDDGITSAVGHCSTDGAVPLPALPAAVRAYVHAALAPRTRQA